MLTVDIIQKKCMKDRLNHNLSEINHLEAQMLDDDDEVNKDKEESDG